MRVCVWCRRVFADTDDLSTLRLYSTESDGDLPAPLFSVCLVTGELQRAVHLLERAMAMFPDTAYDNALREVCTRKPPLLCTRTNRCQYANAAERGCVSFSATCGGVGTYKKISRPRCYTRCTTIQFSLSLLRHHSLLLSVALLLSHLFALAYAHLCSLTH